MASVDLHLYEGALKRVKNLIKVGRAAIPFCDSLYNRTLSHHGTLLKNGAGQDHCYPL